MEPGSSSKTQFAYVCNKCGTVNVQRKRLSRDKKVSITVTKTVTFTTNIVTYCEDPNDPEKIDEAVMIALNQAPSLPNDKWDCDRTEFDYLSFLYRG